MQVGKWLEIARVHLEGLRNDPPAEFKDQRAALVHLDQLLSAGPDYVTGPYRNYGEYELDGRTAVICASFETDGASAVQPTGSTEHIVREVSATIRALEQLMADGAGFVGISDSIEGYRCPVTEGWVLPR